MKIFKMNIINKYKKNKEKLLYCEYYKKAYNTIDELMDYYINEKKFEIAIWGAGLKGNAFLSVFDSNNTRIKHIFDIDSKKFGSSLPTGHKIVDYSKNKEVNVVLVMNNNYENEIAGYLVENEINAVVINVDSVIIGKLTFEEVINMYEGG